MLLAAAIFCEMMHKLYVLSGRRFSRIFRKIHNKNHPAPCCAGWFSAYSNFDQQYIQAEIVDIGNLHRELHNNAYTDVFYRISGVDLAYIFHRVESSAVITQAYGEDLMGMDDAHINVMLFSIGKSVLHNVAAHLLYA